MSAYISFFYCTDPKDEGICFYIGKATNIVLRLFYSGGHIYEYWDGDTEHLVPCKIREYLGEEKDPESSEKKYYIKVEIEEINYYDTDFSKASHRLALAELEEIVKYQRKDQCLFQYPDGVGKSEKDFWEANYKEEK